VRAKKKIKKQNKKKGRPGRQQHSKQVAFYTAPSAPAKVSLGINGSPGVSGFWPATYVRSTQAHHLQNGITLHFCVPWKRYGCAASGALGSGSLSNASLSAFGKTLALGCGVDLDTPGTAVQQKEYFWLNQAIAAYTQNYQRYRPIGKFQFITVPSNATTASARSYWLTVSKDPARFEQGIAVNTDDMFNQASSVIHAAWQSRVLTIDCSENKEWLYANQAVVDSTTDMTTPDLRQRAFLSVSGLTDYSNGSATVISDGYIFIRGTFELDQFGIDKAIPQYLAQIKYREMSRHMREGAEVKEEKDDGSFVDAAPPTVRTRSPTPSRALSASRKLPQSGVQLTAIPDVYVRDATINRQVARITPNYHFMQWKDNGQVGNCWRQPDYTSGGREWLFGKVYNASSWDYWASIFGSEPNVDCATNIHNYIPGQTWATVDPTINQQVAGSATSWDGNSFHPSVNPQSALYGTAYYSHANNIFFNAQDGYYPYLELPVDNYPI